ncbi:unnamed protein product [Malus baccata var. baccata]
MIFIRRHFDEGLKSEYLTVEDPLTLWKALKNRYNHQKMMILPMARYEWTHLRIQDFKTVAEYNSAMFRIISQLKLYGETITKEDMLEKTFSTFHASNVLLLQQYRNQRWISSLGQSGPVLKPVHRAIAPTRAALMKKHQSRPTGSAPFPEVNVVSFEGNTTSSHGNNYKRGRGHKRGRKGKNHGVQFHNQVPRHNTGPSFKNANR